ncbi:MAG: LysR family transcriptional regulator [Chloroflexota bacterium]|jgi:DNA-binding transcriptional LysR family regulator|tara:strand:+ start:3896 stop:4798 length:903 start_codon:yes stop_codon:yes gene_type:complete
MEFSQIQSFVEAERRGSFRKAAKTLFVSQSAVSNRIRLLEIELGAELFDRFRNGVVLTDAGKAFLPYATRALYALNEAKQVVPAHRSSGQNLITIASTRVLGTYTLPLILHELKNKHPDFRAHINIVRSKEVLDLVLNKHVQIGLSRGLVHPDVDTRRLFDEDLVLITNPSHRFTTVGNVDINEVAKEPLILYSAESSYFLLIEQVCNQAGITPNIEIRVDSVDSIKSMVEMGLGISFVPRSSVQKEIKQGTLSLIPLGPSSRVLISTCVLIHRDEKSSASVKAVLSILENLYSKWPAKS